MINKRILHEAMTFVLTRPAKSRGGDRYEHGGKGDRDFMTIYIPQSMSRRDGEIKKEITVTFET